MANTTKVSGWKDASKGRELTSEVTARPVTGSGGMTTYMVGPVNITLMAHDIQANIVKDVNMARVSLYGVMGPPTTEISVRIR